MPAAAVVAAAAAVTAVDAISSLVPGGVGNMPEHLDPWNTPVMDAWSCIVLWMVGGTEAAY